MRRTRLSASLALAALAGAAGGPGCGRCQAGPAGVTGCGGGEASHRRGVAPFAWLRPSQPPASWKVVRIAGGSALAYPPGWGPIRTDPGTASVALLGRRERIDAYLN